MFRIFYLIFLILVFFASACTQKHEQENESTEKTVTWEGNAFVRGSFNNWDLSIPLIKDGSIFYAEATFKKGRNEFKIADKDWKEIDFGSASLEPIQQGVDCSLKLHGGNIAYNLEDDQASFIISIKDVDTKDPIIKIVRGKLSSYE